MNFGYEVQDIWKIIDPDSHGKLFESMPSRVAAIVKAKGDCYVPGILQRYSSADLQRQFELLIAQEILLWRNRICWNILEYNIGK